MRLSAEWLEEFIALPEPGELCHRLEMAGFEDKLAHDLYYMKYRSLMMDLLILWKTAKTVVLLHGV